MKSTLKLFTACCLTVVCATSAVADDQPALYELAYQFKPGEVVRWQVVHRATLQTTMQGNTLTAKTKTESVKRWTVREVTPEGEATFVNSVDRVKMVNQISGRAEVKYDSQKDAEPPAGFADVAKAVDIPLTEARIDRHGKVLERKELQKKISGQFEPPIAIPLPSEPVAIGAVWSEPHEIKVKLKSGESRTIKTRRRFELEAVEDNVAKIAVRFQVLTPVQDPAIRAQLMQRLTKGRIQFDIQQGRLIGQQLKIDSRVLGFNGPTSSMQCRMELNERLLTADEQVANKPEKAAPQSPK